MEESLRQLGQVLIGNFSTEHLLNQTDYQVAFMVHMAGEGLIALAAIVTNSLVLLAIVKEPSLRTPTNGLVANLALADMLVGLVGIPCASMGFFNLATGYHTCLFLNLVVVMLTQVSIFGLVGVAMDRFIAIRYPFIYRRRCSRLLVGFMIGLMWLGAILSSLAVLFAWNMREAYRDTCAFGKVINLSYMVYFNFLGCVLLPLVIILAIYCYIYCIVREKMKDNMNLQVPPDQDTEGDAPRRRQKQRMTFLQDMHVAKGFALLILLFALSWLPIHLMNTIKVLTGKRTEYGYIAAVLLSHANSAVNPAIYAYANSKFRFAIAKLLHCHPRKALRRLSVTRHGGSRSSSVEIQRGCFDVMCPRRYVVRSQRPSLEERCEQPVILTFQQL